jgi:hypothetical protein
MGLAMGVNNLVDIFDEILPPFKRWNFGSFGKLFYRDMKVFLSNDWRKWRNHQF